MPPNTQDTAYGKSLIFIGSKGRTSSCAATGGARGGHSIATGPKGATTREVQGSSEVGGAPVDIGRGGRSTYGLARIDQRSRQVEIVKRTEMWTCGRQIEIRIARIENSGDQLLWEAGVEARRCRTRVLLARKMSRRVGFVASRIPHVPT
jgi:hypothetical protein